MGEKTVRFRDGLKERLPLFVMLFFAVQPLLDAAGYWQARLGIPNAATLVLRMLLLGSAVLTGFFLTDRRKRYYVLFGVLAALTALHAAACVTAPGGYREPVADLVNLVRIWYLPLVTAALITCLRQNGKVWPAMLKGAACALALIAGIMLVSAVTGTDPHTYNYERFDRPHYGVLGWFLWTNSQSAVLSMLCPLAVLFAALKWPGRVLPAAAAAAVGEAALYFLAPRLAFAGLVLSGTVMAAGLAVSDRRRWKTALAVLLITAAFTACYPLSPTAQKEGYADRIGESLQEAQTESGVSISADPSEMSEEELDGLEDLYRGQNYVYSLVERFGRDRVFAAGPRLLYDDRVKKITFCRFLMEDAQPMTKLFGLSLQDMTYERIGGDGKPVTDNFDVENDFHGVFFLTGACGLALMLAFLLFFGLRALIAVIRRPKEYLTADMFAFAAAYGMALIHALFTASVLRRNNASVWLALVLAGLWYLSRARKEDAGA